MASGFFAFISFASSAQSREGKRMGIHSNPDKEQAIGLLRDFGLPTEDLVFQNWENFFGYYDEDSHLQGLVGIELYPPLALLRSLAVSQRFQKRGIGKILVRKIETFAKEKGVQKIFLLTINAEKFFLPLGYFEIDRDSVPKEIAETEQFAKLCLSTSIVLMKQF